MTPSEIATDISAIKPVGEGDVNLFSMSATMNGQDWNQWDR